MSDTRHSGLRVRDADRVDACALLDSARDDGQLTTDEHAERTAKALRARTFGDIDALVGDLQIPRNLVRSAVVNPPRRQRSRRWIPAVATVAAAASIGVLVGVAATDGPGKPGADAPELTTAPGIEHFLADYRAHFGDLLVDELTLLPEHASFERGGPDGTEHFTYRGTFDDSSASSRDPKTRPFDLAAIDLPMLARYLAGAPQTLGTPDGEVTHLILRRSTELPDDGPTIAIYAKGAGDSGYLEISPAGEVLEVFPANR
ncbi:DUF1707 SHOCT-like domain-containing protein [Nocardia blacklockiae]|uniref:DUF1707 SHOCT-like domain-containing protein n=1 Tax=Nocardia blacklockiae TaxID=480036 RepID=UPI0018951CFE|nr:DUF1707 domain-containing protein [Nocardia blacklockiae]MBF6175487.1 DUF1707 domain-containing protein [Nocardia blacklockiae]